MKEPSFKKGTLTLFFSFRYMYLFFLSCLLKLTDTHSPCSFQQVLTVTVKLNRYYAKRLRLRVLVLSHLAPSVLPDACFITLAGSRKGKLRGFFRRNRHKMMGKSLDPNSCFITFHVLLVDSDTSVIRPIFSLNYPHTVTKLGH